MWLVGVCVANEFPTVCAIERLINPIEKTDSISRVIPIAGDFPDNKLNPSFTALRKATTSDQEGFRAILNGGTYSGRTQRAIIDFICDPELEGTEGEAKPKDKYKNSKRAKEEVATAGNSTAMTFVSYGADFEGQKNTDTVMLEWRTKYACENIDHGDGSASTSHWGFFTWFIIMFVLPLTSWIFLILWARSNSIYPMDLWVDVRNALTKEHLRNLFSSQFRV